jgi:hypothetical protein
MSAIESKFNEDRRDNSDAERYGLYIDQVIYWFMLRVAHQYTCTQLAEISQTNDRLIKPNRFLTHIIGQLNSKLARSFTEKKRQTGVIAIN